MKKELTKKILFSPWIGIWFRTYNPKFPNCHTDSHIIKLVENSTDPKKIIRYARKKYGKEFDTRGIPQLMVLEFPIDMKYMIIEESAWYEQVLTEDLFLI